jgi:hypothetical protein
LPSWFAKLLEINFSCFAKIRWMPSWFAKLLELILLLPLSDSQISDPQLYTIWNFDYNLLVVPHIVDTNLVAFSCSICSVLLVSSLSIHNARLAHSTAHMRHNMHKESSRFLSQQHIYDTQVLTTATSSTCCRKSFRKYQ